MSENILYYIVASRNINPCNIISLEKFGITAKTVKKITNNCEIYHPSNLANYIVSVSERNYQSFNDDIYEKGLIPIELNYDEVNFIADRE